MELTKRLLEELQNRLKVGSRRGVHLNAIPARSKYKFDITRLSHINEDLPNNFINALLTQQPLKFKISWKENVPDLNALYEDDQVEIVKITKSFENLINQTDAIESEKGINTFGFGFPILVRRDQADNKLTVAPILIWSLRIKRTKEFNTWLVIRDEDDPIYMNEVLINHLQNDSKIEIDPVSSEMLDDGLIDRDELLDICVNLINSINSTTSSDLRENLSEKLKNIQTIKEKKHYESLPLTSNNSFIDFGGLFSIFEVQKQNIINDIENLFELEGSSIDLEDMYRHYFQPISSIDTDPSQQSILHSLESTRNILIQGPPGTGKSQSLTAILVNALENKKKTIVVCEKKTALEVLHNALNKKGLGQNCVLIKDVVKDRRVVVNSVRERIEGTSYRQYRYLYSKEELDNIILKCKSLIDSINSKHRKIGEKLIGHKDWTAIVGSLLSEIKNNTEEYNLEIKEETFKYDSKELNEILELIRIGQNLHNDFKTNAEFSFLNPSKLVGDNPFLLEQKIIDDFNKYENEIENIKKSIYEYHKEYANIRRSEITEEIETIGEIISDIEIDYNKIHEKLKQSSISYAKIRRQEFNDQLLKVGKDHDQIRSLYNKYSAEEVFLDKEKINSFSFKVKSLFNRYLKDLKTESGLVEKKINEIESNLFECKDIENKTFGSSLLDKKRNFFSFIEHLNSIKNKFDIIINHEFKSYRLDTFLGEDINNQKCFTLLKGILNNKSSYNSDEFNQFIKDVINDLTLLEKEILKKFKQLSTALVSSRDLNPIKFSHSLKLKHKEMIDGLKEIESLAGVFQDKINAEIETIDIFKELKKVYQTKQLRKVVALSENLAGQINKDGWRTKKLQIKSEKQFISYIRDLIIAKENYFDNESDLFPVEFKWFQFYNSRSVFHRKIIDVLIKKENWKKIFLIYYFNTLLLNCASGNLPTNDRDHKELDDSLSELGKEQLKYINEYWFANQINSVKEFDTKHYNLSVENLYNKRTSRKNKRLSLRKIVKYDIDLFTTFFPIILTTPDVCSNLFNKKNKYFDIVLFDEASQLKLEDNLPALLKGKQIIIAGDEHQMPPSNYFSKIFDGGIEDEDDIEDEDEVKVDRDDILLDCESLLDFATELGFEKKYLDFHYRSRHPYLIDFSNHAFYNKRLKPLPNNFDYTPINYIRVDGTYSDNSNDAEAETVLSIIENNIHRLPNDQYPTIGIATFNINQRNLILSKINARRKFDKYALFNEKINELEENGFFVKNLENIQGDERDVIILSTTYGINKDNKFAQRFGSINHQKGYKLLNVIITRAKYKIYVCSSIPEEVFLNYREYLNTEGSNNRRGVFYAYLTYSKAVSDGDDELREAVLNTLTENTQQSTPLDILNEDLESPFEEEVYLALTEHFDEDKIIPQFAFAGFRIDLVYDSKNSNIPKIAIECDGAAYHSSQEAYLHDRHRQKMLEGHGFVFHRIWSTNWWRNPKRETKKLVAFIKQIEGQTTIAFNGNTDLSQAFTNMQSLPKREVSAKSSVDKEKDEETIETFRDTFTEVVVISKIVVESNSKVSIKYLNNNKLIKIQLVDSDTQRLEMINGIQKINIRSPLAKSLIGKEVGEVTQVGNLDNYVEVMEIMN